MTDVHRPGIPASPWDRWADDYDALNEHRSPDVAVARLADLAGSGTALELGIGTGRVALPLEARGVDVQGIDASSGMGERLRAKPGGSDIPVVLGDFRAVPAEGPFSLVFVVYGTFFCLVTQEAQVECFRNVAGRLGDDGVFVLEAFVPDLTRFTRGQSVLGLPAEDAVSLEVSRHDAAAQRVFSQRIILREEGLRLLPVEIRYCWPSELDLMAQLAGLRLRERHAGWEGEPFTVESGLHVSVYERES